MLGLTEGLALLDALADGDKEAEGESDADGLKLADGESDFDSLGLTDAETDLLIDAEALGLGDKDALAEREALPVALPSPPPIISLICQVS